MSEELEEFEDILKNIDEELLYTQKEVAEKFLKCSPKTVYLLRKKGKIKAIKLHGGSIRYTREEVKRYVLEEMEIVNCEAANS